MRAIAFSAIWVVGLALVCWKLWIAIKRPPIHGYLGFSDPFAGKAEEQGRKMWEDLERKRGRDPSQATYLAGQYSELQRQNVEAYGMECARRAVEADRAVRPRERIRLTSTHTFAVLEVTPEMFDLVAAKLKDAGYDHAFVDGYLDMHGIALEREGCR